VFAFIEIIISLLFDIQVEKWNEQRDNGTFPGPL
jgi:hypothetical protein